MTARPLRTAAGPSVLVVLCVLAHPDHAQTTHFHETFDKAGPLGWLKKNATTRLTGTDGKGWKASLSTNDLVECGIAEGPDGNRYLLHEPQGSGGTDRTILTCPLRRPISGASPITLKVSFTPLAVNRGGPNPWNKLFYLRLREAATGFGYGTAFDVQAYANSPDNRLLRIEAYTPTNLPNVDDLRPTKTGFWVGPRMDDALVGVRFEVTLTFTPEPEHKRSQIEWQLVNTETGKGDTGEVAFGHVLPGSANLDTIQLMPTHWAHGWFDDIQVQTGAAR